MIKYCLKYGYDHLPSAAQMKYLDEYTINNLGVPSLLLMERASEYVAKCAVEIMRNEKAAAVFCGSGNNGGDGIGAAIYLEEQGIPTRVFLVGKREKMTRDTKAMEQRYNAIGKKIEDFDSENMEIQSFTMECSVIVDAIFGTGLNSPLREPAVSAVRLMNISSAPTVSADIPTGVETDTGRILGDAVKADATVTFTFAKPGIMSVPGKLCCGKVRVCDIGIDKSVLQNISVNTFAVNEESIRLSHRKQDTHKGDYGKTLIIAGSEGYTGAPLLASEAAVRTGAGLVFLGVPARIYGIEAARCREAMPFPLADEKGIIAKSAKDEILRRLSSIDVCLIGPGLGRSKAVTDTVISIIEKAEVPVVVDADGINAVSMNINILDKAKYPVILTPHDGEYARLGGVISDGDRIGSAREFAKKHNIILVLKGHRTVTAFHDGNVVVNTGGNPGMAKGGSGDVLSGVIAALVGQMVKREASVEDALKLAVPMAVYIHSAAGDMATAQFGEYSVTPSDMINALPKITKKLLR